MATAPSAVVTQNFSPDVIISMERLDKYYHDFHVLRNVNLQVHKGERIVICGPSGSGKSTLIRCIQPARASPEG